MKIYVQLYKKETNSVIKNFEIFISCRLDNAKKTALSYNATPSYVTDFLIWKKTTELLDKAHVHVMRCPILVLDSATERGTKDCGFSQLSVSATVEKTEEGLQRA